ncbi:hypothetical protein KIW84_060948 [Lathyrus oleraceus]|uniref:Uncharacterized protein n=1 Tax=Pisum sativum TaxID=3888 RepID=A0A9D4W425_PEA|nr:hypothetical protein KIW84_060948 [Pisum sativum]
MYQNSFLKIFGLDELNRNSFKKLVRRRGADGRIPDRSLGQGASSSAVELTGYPGGPYDTSLLVKYEHHVARHLWFGEERGPKKELKSPQDVTEEVVVELAVDYLGVSQGEAQSHVRSCRGSYYKLEWLYDLLVQYRAASRWAYATRAYLLMLVDSTIFADKTFTLVEARIPPTVYGIR